MTKNNGCSCFCIYLYENHVNTALYSDGLIVPTETVADCNGVAIEIEYNV